MVGMIFLAIALSSLVPEVLDNHGYSIDADTLCTTVQADINLYNEQGLWATELIYWPEISRQQIKKRLDLPMSFVRPLVTIVCLPA